ncbi:MAG: class II fumarate hydratase [Acidimicrobiales bacterium]
MGEVRVPAAAKWQAQTQRAVENFPISGARVPLGVIHALARIKGAMAAEKSKRRMMPKAKADAIRAAAAEVARGGHDGEFPIDVFQTGSGTSTNMNVNEVLATLAAGLHPNDDVNAPLSSNDQFPSAMHVAAADGIARRLIPGLRHLATALRRQEKRLASVVKAGRTHLMDATPVTLGQEFGGYATQVEQAAERLEGCVPRVGELPLGGSAVGTGINVPAGFAAAVVARLAKDTKLPLSEAGDHLAANASRDALVEASGHLRTAAVALTKIAEDIRWMGSGPSTGLGELHLPDLQPGSSIMPGKVNPVLCEAVLQVAAQVIGNDAAVAWSGARGNFELNVMLPVLARNLLESIDLLANVARLFADRCVDGIEADEAQCRRYAESTPQVATALNPRLGYETVAGIVKEAASSRRSIREVVLARGLLDEEELDTLLDPLSLANPR